MANVLILHHNYPGQFGFLQDALIKLGHTVYFLVETKFVKAHRGVTVGIVKHKHTKNKSNLDTLLSCSVAFEAAFKSLKSSNFIPDITICHSGWGLGTFVKDVFPHTLLISYAEWWFNPHSIDANFDSTNKWFNYSQHNFSSLAQRNLFTSFQLSISDHIVVPTFWQRSQFPPNLALNMHVIHEGVDTNFFHPLNEPDTSRRHLRITYATRGMEPIRAFPEFIDALVDILPKAPSCEVVIAGEDRIAYGGVTPISGSYGSWAKERLYPYILTNQVKFVGRLPLQKYLKLLQTSDIHIYLTRPFVPSWSLLESMSTGCTILSSNVEPVMEILGPIAGLYVDHTNHASLVSGISDIITSNHEVRSSLSFSARRRAVDLYNRSDSINKWLSLL